MFRSFFNAFVAFIASVLMCDVSVFGNIANGKCNLVFFSEIFTDVRRLNVLTHELNNFYLFYSTEFKHVTCGSAVKLLNPYHSVRLHSHEVKYGSGSGQQVGL